MSDALEKFTAEVMERYLGLETWISRQPEGAFGLAIVPRAVYRECDDEMFLIDDDELRVRAALVLPRDRCHGGPDSVLVVAPMHG